MICDDEDDIMLGLDYDIEWPLEDFEDENPGHIQIGVSDEIEFGEEN